MSKEEFLHILREKLSILDEKEMEDILNEYEQHIDMKTAGAMTEEEAIEDFGNLDELAADILEAYHVRSDYAKEGAAPGGQTAERLKEGLTRTAAKLKDVFGRFGSWCRSGWESFEAFWRRISEKYFGREKASDNAGEKAGRHDGRRSEAGAKAERTEGKLPQDTAPEHLLEHRRARGFWGSLWDSLKRGTRRFWNFCKRLVLFCIRAGVWCVKWIWNFSWIAVGGMMGIGAVFCLFFLGALLVLWSQGYPAAGLTIGMAGGSLCMISLTGLPFTFLTGLKKKERNRREEAVIVLEPEEEEENA